MKILLTGGTGFIGSAVLSAARDHGHDVLAVVRSAEAAAAVSANGATALVGDVTDGRWFDEQLRLVDGAIHAAAPSSGAAEFDAAVAASVVATFGGTDKPYLHTGGIWAYGDNTAITEESPRNAPPLVAWRAGPESTVLNGRVAATVIEPGIVHGGSASLTGLVAAGPRADNGALVLLGSGDQHWATVHVDDLAELYVLALQRGSGLGRLVAASGHNPTVRQIGEAVAGPAGVQPSSRDQARARLGEAFADALLLDQAATGAKARSLGWAPRRATLLEELGAVAAAA